MSSYVTTNHPFNDQLGMSVEKTKYSQIKKAIISVLGKNKEVSLIKLIEDVKTLLVGSFDGSISWHVTAVKLDLEARKKIICVRSGDGQHISLSVNNLSKRSLAKYLA